MDNVKKIIAIGGSAGSLPIVLNILQQISRGYIIPIVIILHRLKNTPSEMDKIVSITRSDLRLREPDDKEPIEPGYIYIAPANYHLLIEADRSFGLDYSEPVQYSRPSIDVTFESIAAVYGPAATAILLSGANNDGSEGIARIIERGGMGIIQAPSTSEYPVMPNAAIRKNATARVCTPQEILNYLEELEPF